MAINSTAVEVFLCDEIQYSIKGNSQTKIPTEIYQTAEDKVNER